MIKGIKVTNYLGESISLPLKYYPEEPGLVIEEIDGLGPAKADINMTEMATVDGALDNSSRLNTRDIKLSFIFAETKDNPIIEDIRLMTYKYFPIKQTVTLEIETDRRLCTISGRVETNEPTIFSDMEGCDITILCAFPYFSSKAGYDNTFYGVTHLFKFPFSNEGYVRLIDYIQDDQLEVIEDDKKEGIESSETEYYSYPSINFGEINRILQQDLIYNGDAEVGISLEIHTIGPVSGITIINGVTREQIHLDDEKIKAIMQEDEGEAIQTGDSIIINSKTGKKTVTLIRHAERTNIINALGLPITWFTLKKGHNSFICEAESGLENIVFVVKADLLYEGV